MGSYVPSTPAQRQEMLEAIGLHDFRQLYRDVPEEMLLRDGLDLPEIGPLFEHDPLFPQGVNTEFIQVLDSRTLKMRVWERGSGETMACGTGACASAVAAILCGRCKEGEDIVVKLRGGDLTIRVEGSRVWMTGEAVTVFEGTVNV